VRKMKREVSAVTLCALLFALCVRAEAQQPAKKIPRLGFLDSGSASDPRNALGFDAFRQGLRELGYVEGKDINIEYRYDEGKPERL
jgi:putative tryptophan/tyrosine transport system substrate-binding protein